MNKPHLSVIVPHGGGRASLWHVVHALTAQTMSREAFEVILVDDGVNLGKDALRYLATMGIVVLQNARLGVGGARNSGIGHASGELIVFLDDDCVPNSNLLAAYAAFFEENPDVDGAGGAVRAVPQEGALAAYAAHRGLLSKPVMLGAQVVTVITANCCFRAAAIRGAGMFDTRLDRLLGQPGGEDADLSYRLRMRKSRLAFCPTAVAAHYHPTTLRAFVAQQARNGAGLLVHSRLRGIPMSDHGLPEPHLGACLSHLTSFIIRSHPVSGASLLRRVAIYARQPRLPMRYRVVFPMLDLVRRMAYVAGIRRGQRVLRHTWSLALRTVQ